MTAHDEAVKAAAEALGRVLPLRVSMTDAAEAAVAAAAPILLAAERQRVAETIRAEGLYVAPSDWASGMFSAARIAEAGP